MDPHDLRQLPIAVAPDEDESGLGLVLRALRVNGVPFSAAARWLHISRNRALQPAEVRAMAWALHLSADDLAFRLTLLEPGRRTRWVRLAGHRLSRGFAPTTMPSKVCPECLRSRKVVRLGWLLHCLPACAEHGCLLMEKCPACGKPIAWDRPDLDVCGCGRYLRRDPLLACELGAGTLAWLRRVEDDVAPDRAVRSHSASRLPRMMAGLSLDGAYRLIQAFGLLESPSTPARTAREQARSALGRMLVIERGLQRLHELDDDFHRAPQLMRHVHLPALVHMVEDAAAPADSLLATCLLDGYQSAWPARGGRSGPRPRRQLPLFI